ncbi:sigma-70 family RNA polymerase sigma factor [Novosphingobium humi]|uniref:Sigma-70 family RNA polymerase sigma factor n=1 Tax=Novosphingobium humi TaxID=2282397 RepID=A0ABY7TWT8_9SPHN|nr:sigma-70 family RNA polymerase sigma factor [Novosphingobium humi]WCT77728.1 sigma-70 family RNA polymerase sigma factor [Novosphingobium humi]
MSKVEAQPPDFKRELTQVTAHLRAFARGLCGRPDLADDLVQDTLLRAWAARDRFVPGTSIRAWTFTILRNAWFTEMRRNRFRADYDETVADRILTSPAGQEAPLHLADLSRALMELPAERREALLLVGAGGFSYEEAAAICGCAVGTIKSRVGRGRAQLTAMIEEGRIPTRGNASESSQALMAELDRITPKD